MSLSNIDIIKKFEDKYWSNPTRWSSQTITPLEFELSADNELLLKQVDQLTQKCITELHRGKKYKIKTLSSIFSLDPFIIKRIIRRNARILAIKRKISKTFSRHRKLEDVHIDFIRQLLVNSKSDFLSIQSIKTKLLANFNEINDISEATVRRVVSKDLHFSFKILEIWNPSWWKHTVYSHSWNSMILLEIQSWCKEVVYIDEFTVSSRHYSNYGWAPKGIKGYLKHFENNFKMIFILAFSKDRIYGVVSSSQTSDSKVFRYFLHKIFELIQMTLKNNLGDVVFVMDNHSIHKSDMIKKFILN